MGVDLAKRKPQWDNSRKIRERIYIRGRLVLQTPAHFGNGDTDAITDIPLLRDSLDGRSPLLTGTSIAGALRNYLREAEAGHGAVEDPDQDAKLLAEQLFGHLVGREGSVMSCLMVDDARGTLPTESAIEIRDGVAIDPGRRTAEIDEKGKGKKFDLELLPAGTSFPLSLELVVYESDNRLKEALAIALHGLEEGRIGLGMRKRRGYGRCKVSGWQVHAYRMDTAQGLIGWLTHPEETAGADTWQPDIVSLLNVRALSAPATECFEIDAEFQLESSLLIRSSTGNGDDADAVHLRSWRNGRQVPVLSGTSLAGVIRSRARKIAVTLKGENAAQEYIDRMFGRRIQHSKDIPSGSRVIVYETEIRAGIRDQVQTRVKIDRFTGGAFPQALFSQQPVFAGESDPATVRIRLQLRKTADANAFFHAEVGLLLLVLKDLWTGDLPLGGESSVGRGRLKGMKADLKFPGQAWRLETGPDGSMLIGGDKQFLEENFLQAFLKEQS